ncbi:hypothetical protein K474DRAFT_1365005 [Panus rudis PR-1116 ss-1]|nr:hypothetical protein K474DRAFT_1365005 [Panus rudis PR-1116 ss-1]
MHRYNPNAPLPSSSANAGHSQQGAHDREGSLSGPETSYTHYLPDHSQDVEDDPHLALTSQTLNPDGTPKRPMNAFMIFARRRRPQISAENQMMRTGEISKILSKEWTSMDMKDKKFYLDQAKKLKDNFNSKYPDYVYRRRPNNSRRKRKSDSDPHSPSDPTAEMDEGVYEETSPIEGEYPPEPVGYPYPRSHNSSSSSYEAHEGFSSSGYNYPADYPNHLNHGHGRMMAGTLDSSLPVSTAPTVRIPAMNDSGSGAHSYQYSPYSAHPSSSISPHEAPHSAASPWDPSRVSSRSDQGRPSWPTLPALDTSLTRQRSSDLSTMSSRSDALSPHAHKWSSSTSSTSSSSPGATGPHYSGNASFPTLTSTFQPTLSPVTRNDMIPSPASQTSNTSDYYSPSSAHTRNVVSSSRHGGHEATAFVQNQTLPRPSGSAYMAGSPTGSWPAPYSRATAHHDQRQSPTALPTISGYSLQHSANSNSPPPGPHASQSAGYWDRKYESH